jgi:hypothetical protein
VFVQILLERYLCPESFLNVALSETLSQNLGFFKFGPDATCYGRSAVGYLHRRPRAVLYDVKQHVVLDSSELRVPFDPTEIVDNLRRERYVRTQPSLISSIAKDLYYRVRPNLPIRVRRTLQKGYFRGRGEQVFPYWPVDTTVETICEQLLLSVISASGVDRIPFIWFWPRGYSSCFVMTHDVETGTGRNYCERLMDMDEFFGIKAVFNIVPERRYSVSTQFLDSIRSRGFEIGVHDLNHDGRLFDDYKEFLRRASRINAYGAEYGAKGFRSGVLYRNPDWYDALKFSFDMSIPNTAHFDPQPGGCCTVMPYFIGDILELPVTTIQDYTLSYILGQRSIELWKQQIDLITKKNGLISCIIHPDYVVDATIVCLYEKLLEHLCDIKPEENIWVTLPSEVDAWWRLRSKLRIAYDEAGWRIVGEGADRAVVAYAQIVDDKLRYDLEATTALPMRG